MPQIFELFWILEEGVMRASRLMRGFKTAKKMRHYHDIKHITNCTKLFFYHHLDIVRADDTSALSDFRCGMKLMDDFIQDRENGLAKFIKLRLSNLWIVFEDGKAVAFFALSKDALMLNNEDRRNIEGKDRNAAALPAPDDADKFWNKEKFPAIEIDYFAVCEDRRKRVDDH